MPPQKMIVNGLDLSLYGMWVETPEGWGDGPSREDQLIDVQGAGAMLVSEAARIGPRRWTVGGVLMAPTAADARDLWDAAKLVLADARLEVMILPWDDRLCVCRLQSMAWERGRLEDVGFRFRLAFLAPSAYLVAPQLDSYGLVAGSEIAIALGTAPSPFVAQFVGPATAPSLTYTDANGETRGTVRLAADLAAREWLHFDSQTFLLERHTAAGVVLNGASYFSNASRLFVLNPYDGVLGSGPTLALDAGSAVVTVRRCYQ